MRVRVPPPAFLRHSQVPLIAEKVDGAGPNVRQIELCPQHCEIVVKRECPRGLEICESRGRARIERERGAPHPYKTKGAGWEPAPLGWLI